MDLTHIDCFFDRGNASSLQQSSFVGFNPGQTPGRLVLAGASAARASIGSQVACKLALEHFVEGSLDFFSGEGGTGAAEDVEKSVQALEAGFKQANTNVYSFGHKLAAGGRLAASLLGIVIEEGSISAGRVGSGSAYLFRDHELYPFFEEKKEKKDEERFDTFVGSNSMVAVELATVPLEGTDFVLFFSERLSEEQEDMLKEILLSLSGREINPCKAINHELFESPSMYSYSALARIGPPTIYLGAELVRA